MILSTMSYEEVYNEILKDSPDLFATIAKQLPDYQKHAKRAKGAYGRIYSWKHPKSQNIYTYFFHIKRHSDWDKTPRLITYTEYNTELGKRTITIMRDPDGNIRVGIFKPHFFERYDERNLAKYEEFSAETERDIKIAFLMRTSTTMPLGDKLASIKEQEKEEPDFINDALLTLEGLMQCKIYKKNPNIVLFKTFLSVQDLYQGQYEEVLKNAIHVFFLRATNDSARYQKSINETYLNGIKELNEISLNQEISPEEKQKTYLKKYGEVIDEFKKYIL